MADEGATLRERVSTLEKTVAELDAQLDGAVNRDVPLLKGTVRAVVDAEIDDIGELPDAGRAFNRQVATHGERLDAVERQLAALGDVETAKTTKEQKLAAIRASALNKRGSQSTVTVTAEGIQGCVGVSRRYAYDLIRDTAETRRGSTRVIRAVGANDRPYYRLVTNQTTKPHRTYPNGDLQP